MRRLRISTTRDLYEVLDVDAGASDEALKAAYRRLALQHHPDRNRGSRSAEERFKELAEAYEVLSNPEARGHYDRFRELGRSPRTVCPTCNGAREIRLHQGFFSVDRICPGCFGTGVAGVDVRVG